MDLNAFSSASLSLPPAMDMAHDPSAASGAMNADALWKRFDDPSMSSQLAMFPFGGAVRDDHVLGFFLVCNSAPHYFFHVLLLVLI